MEKTKNKAEKVKGTKKGQKVNQAKAEKAQRRDRNLMIGAFVIILAFIIALPYLDDIMSFLRTTPSVDIVEPETPAPEEIPEKDFESGIYPLAEASFRLNNLEFTNFRRQDNHNIHFTIGNHGSEVMFFVQSDHFLELFDAQNTLLERVMIRQNATINTGDTRGFTFPISENTYQHATSVRVVIMTPEAYPMVSLNLEEETQFLVCTNRNRQITYYFDDYRLFRIRDITRYENITENFTTLFTTQSLEITTLNNRDGITATILPEGQNSFTTTIIVDLRNVSDLNNRYYFGNNTPARTVAFEMRAMSFTCQ